MAKIPTFDARAPRRGNLEPPTDSGAADALASIAQVSGALANRFGRMADEAAIRQGVEDATAQTAQVAMPTADYAFDGSTPSTTPVASPNGGRLPAGMRNNNPGNIKFVGGSRMAGVVGPSRNLDQGDPQAVFATPEHGMRAAWQLALRKYSGGKASANQLIAGEMGWTPGNFQAAANVARTIGIAPDADLRLTDPAMAQRFMRALLLQEHGPASAAYSDAMIAAAVNGGGTPAVPASPPATSPAGGVTITVTGQPGAMPRVAGGTLYGDAFNRAASTLHMDRLDTAMRMQMATLSFRHEGNPAALAEALDAMRAGYVADLRPEERAAVDQSFQRQKFALVRQASREFEQNTESAAQAAIEQNIERRKADIFRMAQKAGTDAAADAALASELGALSAQIDGSTLSPLAKSRYKEQAAAGVVAARVLGGFERRPDAAGRAAYLKTFQDEFKAGDGVAGQIDLDTYDRINGELMRRVQSDEVQAARKAAAIDKGIDAQISFLKKGFPVPDAARQRLAADVAATGDAGLADNMRFLDHLADWQKAHVAARPDVLDAQIAALRARIQREGITEAAATSLDVMEGLRDEMAKGLSTDPLTWANRAGVLTVEPLDFKDGATLTASLSERVSDAAAVAAHYGIEPKFFTPAETDGLKKMLKAAPLALPSIVSALEAGLGRDTPRALAEVSKDAPLLAHVAGLVHATGSQRPAVEIGEALQLRQTPGYKSAMPTAAKLQGAANVALGRALTLLPGTLAGATEAAAALAEIRAANRGVDMEGFDQDGSAGRELFLDALDETLGATMRDGEKFGGLTEVNGRPTIAPPEIAADALGEMLRGLSEDDLLFQQGVGTANGVPVGIDAIRAGQLVMTAIGRYRIATGDIEGGDPKYLAAADGGYFELDAAMLKKSQERRGMRIGGPRGGVRGVRPYGAGDVE